MDMFSINKYVYVDRASKTKFEIYSRTLEFADKLVLRINKLGNYNLTPKRFRFCRPMVSEIPPYNIEREQVETVSKWEENANGQKENGKLADAITTYK